MKQKKRAVVIALALFGLFSLLIVHYFKIQILEGEKWTKQALAQHEFLIKEPFRRGAFYACSALKKGHPESAQPLVCDVTYFHLYADPLSIPSECRQEVAQVLETYVSLQAEDLARKCRNRRLASWVEREKRDAILAWWLPFAKQHKIGRNALYFVTDYRRSYPHGAMLGQVLHTIRELKEEETGVGLPTGGLEAYFHEYLKGKMGKRKLLRSPLNQLETDKVIEAPEDGADVYLTIDPCIQAVVEEELERAVHSCQAKGGWATMMDPYTGEILALAQYPFFDPTHYQDFFNDPDRIEDTKVKAVTDGFELGSIMKPITLAIALKANQELKRMGRAPLFDPEEKIDVTRSIFPGRASKPLYDRPGHTVLNMYMALQKSSNVYMAQLADRIIHTMGADWYRAALVDCFGFSRKTGIELPGEASGMVPTPHKVYANGMVEWSLSTPYSLSIGYNILATSMQMLRAYALLANGGFLVKPTLVKKVVQRGELCFESVPPHLEGAEPLLDKSILREVVSAMKFVTKPGGKGLLASVGGYTEAGKTGTAEKIIDGVYAKQWHISSFVGFAPVDHPRFILMVSMDEAKPIRLEGGIKNYTAARCAAPVFSAIAQRTLEYLGEPLDDPYGFPPGDPRYDPERADWIKETHALKTLYEQWNGS